MPAGTDPSSGVQSDGGVTVPAAIRAKHPTLVELILASESMNNAERQYWIDILPAMNAEQSEQLQAILQKEHDQLAAIDAKYDKQIEEIAQQQRPLKEIESALRSKAAARHKEEAASEKREENSAQDILRKIEEL